MPSVLFETTPAEITSEITAFCNSVAPGSQPVYVPVRPQPEAAVGRCQPNVERHVRASGGSEVAGWIIWQSEALLHAEFHVNWRSPADVLIDLTPKADGEESILFLPDPATRWTVHPVPSRRTARHPHPLIALLVQTAGASERLLAGYPAGSPVAPPDEARLIRLSLEYQKLAQEIELIKSLESNPKTRAAARRAERRR